MLSVAAQYAIRATVLLMKTAPEARRMGISEIACEIDANEHTTGKILQQLVRAGLICSAKGPTGGFYIPLSAAPIYLMDVVEIFDGTTLFSRCGLGLKECSEEQPCPIHFTYKAAREALYQQFSSLTIQQLANDLSLGKAFLKR